MGRLRSWLFRSRLKEELDQELQHHLDRLTELHQAEGMPEEEARRAARRDLGNQTRIQEDHYWMTTVAFFETLARDLRYALRGLRKNPGFTFVAVLTLGLGIGANTAIFSLLDAVMFSPLPFRDPDQLVRISEDMTARGGPATVEASPATYLSWRDQNRALANPVFEDVAVVDGFSNYNIVGNEGDPERVGGAAVSGNLFPMLGVRPILGRTLLPEDDQPDHELTVIISDALWKRRFGSDPGLLGKAININGTDHTVVGVVPGAFQFPNSGYELWVPLRFTPEQATSRFNFYLTVIGRLRPGVTMDQAFAATQEFTSNLQQQYPGADKIGATVEPLHDVYVGSLRSALGLLLATVGIVLLVACTNVAQLLLARGTGRRQEIALRGALGAERRDLVRQLLTENIVLAGLGAIVGVGLASTTFWYLARLIPSRFPTGTEVTLSQPVLWFTLAVGALTALIFGAGPALVTSRLELNDILKRGGRSIRHRSTARGLLITAQIALTVVLLIGAGLLLRSYTALRDVDPGFVAGGVLIADTDLSPARYAELPARLRFYDSVLERVRQLPGVASASFSNYVPLTMKGGRLAFGIEGRPDPEPGQLPVQQAVDRVVSSDYFSTMNVRLLEGRTFDQRDVADSTPVVIINRAMARTFWPGEDPLGKRLRIFGENGVYETIVGITEDVRQINLDAEPEPELYLPMTQISAGMAFFWPHQLVVRAKSDPMALAGDIRQAVWAVDPQQPVSNIRTMDQVVDQEFAGRDTQLVLVGTFAGLALVLAAIGLYGVLSYTVAQRRSEIGLRMALGARRSTVIGMVLWQTLVLTGIGLMLGVGAALILGRYMESFLYGVTAMDVITYPVVAAVLIATAMLASYVPARRATSVDPVDALRAE